MRKSFVNVSQPMLAAVVKERTPQDAWVAIKNCEYHGATGIDLHLSCLEKEYQTEEWFGKIINNARVPVLALNYNSLYDQSFYTCEEEERVDLLWKAVKAGASAVDIQGYTFDLYSKTNFREEFSHLDYSFIKGNPKEVVVDSRIIDKQMEFIERVHGEGAEVLLSNHPGIPMTTQQVVDLALFVEKRNPDIIKIVTIANNEDEMAEAIKTMVVLKKEVKTPVSYHCSGTMGSLTRVVNPALGGFMAFCNDSYTPSSLLEQPDLTTTKLIIENLKKVL